MSRKAIVLLTVGVVISSTVLFAQKTKSAHIGNFPFWSAPKGGHMGQFVPGQNAALLLTSSQIEQIEAARQSTVGSESLRDAVRIAKDPNAGETERQAARAALEKAQEDLHRQVDSILSADQKALIARINTLFADTWRTTAKEFESKFAAAKGNKEEAKTLSQEMKERVALDFTKALTGILSAEQQAAVARAAEAEKQAASKKKGDK